MNTKNASFTIKPFKNRNGAISWRVSGWLLGERVRKNFKTREEAILERGTLQMKQAQADSKLRMASTFLTEPQLREAEAMFLKLETAPRPLTFYVNYGFEHYKEPKTCQPISTAVTDYLAERTKDIPQGLLCQRHHNAIRIELTHFQEHFPQRTVAELTTGQVIEYIRRGHGAQRGPDNKVTPKPATLRTQNNRRAILLTFFKYCVTRKWLVTNPLEGTTRHRVDHSRGSAPALSAQQAAQLMAHVETIYDGALVPYFALCLFAGIRPDGELSKLPASDVRPESNSITIEPWVSKVNMRRLITIQPNLAAWLKAYPLDQFPIIPPKTAMKNLAGKLSKLRRQFGLAHDVLRHSFISMHVAKFRSMGDAALQAGNSESIIRRHYLNVTTPQEAEAFFSIMPKK